MITERYKRIIFRIIALAAVFLVGFYVGGRGSTSKSPAVLDNTNQGQNSSEQVSVMFDFQNGTIFIDEVPWKQGMTVFDALKLATDKEQLGLKYKDYGGTMGVFVQMIGKTKNSESGDRWWQFWVNNNYGKEGASNYSLKQGDAVEWKLVRGQIKN
ncbi:MAG: DUF4430 domain-containing protein [Candidatus Paceibacterota bacterium]|jgi:hypothetical protein